MDSHETSFAQNVCLDPNSSDYSDLEIPENCGIVQVLVDSIRMGYQEGESVQDTSFRCKACKPGFKAGTDQYLRITSCTQISNCDAVSFYGCKQCATGYMFGYSNDYLVIDYGVCLSQTQTPNCFAGIESAGKFYCRICGPGYKVNLDGQCDPVEVSNCAT